MMKTKLVTIILAFTSVFATAQITVTDADVVGVGDIVYMAYDHNPSSQITIGNPGLSQVWDFSSLQVLSVDTELYISPIGTQYENLYPNANLCLNADGTTSYLDVSSNGVYGHGFNDTAFSAPALLLPLPLTYGLTTSDGPIVILEEVITGAALAIAIPAATVAVLTNNMANRADTALIQVTNTSDFSVTASGNIITPLGTYDVLRLKEVKEISSVLNVYCSDTITQAGMWLNNIPFSSIPMLAGFSNEEQEIVYRWITNDTAVSYLVAAVSVDSSDVVQDVSFQTAPNVSSVAQLAVSSFNVYPIPASYTLTVAAENHLHTELQLIDVNGKLVMKKEFTNTTNLNLSILPKGAYYLNLLNEQGMLTKKVIVE